MLLQHFFIVVKKTKSEFKNDLFLQNSFLVSRVFSLSLRCLRFTLVL